MTDLPWEDNLVERKVNPSKKDMTRTIVAFANSVKQGHTAKFYIGERDDGTTEGVVNPETTQITVQEVCDKIYPPITNTCKSKVYEKDGKPCVCVEIEYDGDTPHFAGKAFVRRGSQTIKASEEVFQKLIELRLGKVRELAKWIGKGITIAPDQQALVSTSTMNRCLYVRSRFKSTLLSVNNFWTTFLDENGKNMSMPLEKIILNWDDEGNCLKLLIKP
ncbi:MAG: helix-turn-helix domain-containing protein [Candidatus Scalinduaceae bacterium]